MEIALAVGEQHCRQDAGKDQADSDEKEHPSGPAFPLLLHVETRTPRLPPASGVASAHCPTSGASDPCQAILARVPGKIADINPFAGSCRPR
ncbi:hypothetical protein [Pararhizobium sp. A13]|uniref:hypothetical protein n=1 Tax=Pararhizobium sp. A13 TaxID=3133975 RepID=UPI00324D3EC3